MPLPFFWFLIAVSTPDSVCENLLTNESISWPFSAGAVFLFAFTSPTSISFRRRTYAGISSSTRFRLSVSRHPGPAWRLPHLVHVGTPSVDAKRTSSVPPLTPIESRYAFLSMGAPSHTSGAVTCWCAVIACTSSGILGFRSE